MLDIDIDITQYKHLNFFSYKYSFEKFADIQIGTEFRFDKQWLIKIADTWGKVPNVRELEEEIFFSIPTYKMVCVLNKPKHKIN
jgi:hypothetical protein